jgi:hypothetical protein
MYVGQDFDPIEPGEVDAFTLDFTADVGVGNTILNATWTCSVQSTLIGSTVDAVPQSRVYGAATVNNQGGKNYTSQVLTSMVDGNNYIVQATVQTSDGRLLQRYSHVLCRVAQ